MAKLATNFKIQISKGEGEGDKEEVAIANEKIYVCPYCQKEFSNGKVYGGHKRSHSRKNKNKGHFQDNISNSKNHEEGVEDFVPVDKMCLVCDESLYGHMKKHSERARRGMKHPHALNETSSLSIHSIAMVEDIDSTDGDAGFVADLSKALTGWSKTGKRGRESKGRSLVVERRIMTGQTYNDDMVPSLTKSSGSISASHDGASNLLALSEANSTKPSLPPKKRKYDFSANEDRKISPLKDKHASITSHKHVCNICNRSFKSYQALGGHKAHHGKKKYNSSHSFDDGFSCVEDDDLSRGMRHECPFCNKIFSKGQALGGHKRHCKRIVDRILGFDLNEAPPEENEDGQETISLPWTEDGIEHDSYSSPSI